MDSKSSIIDLQYMAYDAGHSQDRDRMNKKEAVLACQEFLDAIPERLGQLKRYLKASYEIDMEYSRSSFAEAFGAGDAGGAAVAGNWRSIGCG